MSLASAGFYYSLFARWSRDVRCVTPENLKKKQKLLLATEKKSVGYF